MIAYFDTSAIVKILVDEEGTDAARNHWARASRALSSLLMYPETMASLAAARRNGRIDAAGYRRVRIQLDAMWEEVTPVACGLDTVRRAADLAESDGLRGCDAIHLASPLSVGLSELVFVAWDRDLSKAARRNGLAVTA